MSNMLPNSSPISDNNFKKDEKKSFYFHTCLQHSTHTLQPSLPSGTQSPSFFDTLSTKEQVLFMPKNFLWLPMLVAEVGKLAHKLYIFFSFCICWRLNLLPHTS